MRRRRPARLDRQAGHHRAPDPRDRRRLQGGAGAQRLVRRRKAARRTLHPHVDIGIAVDTDDGLFVPALRNADMLDARRLRAAINRLRDAGRGPQHPGRGTERLHDLAVELRHVRRPLRDAGGGAAVRRDRRRRQAAPRRGAGDGRHRNAPAHAAVADLRPPRLHRRRGGALPARRCSTTWRGRTDCRAGRPAASTQLDGGPEPAPRRTTMAHRSRLAGFIIDCQTGDLDAAAQFWSARARRAASPIPTRAATATTQLLGDTPRRPAHRSAEGRRTPRACTWTSRADDIDAEADAPGGARREARSRSSSAGG